MYIQSYNRRLALLILLQGLLAGVSCAIVNGKADRNVADVAATAIAVAVAISFFGGRYDAGRFLLALGPFTLLHGSIILLSYSWWNSHPSNLALLTAACISAAVAGLNLVISYRLFAGKRVPTLSR